MPSSCPQASCSGAVANAEGVSGQLILSTLQVRHYQMIGKAGRVALEVAASAALLLQHRCYGHAAKRHRMQQTGAVWQQCMAAAHLLRPPAPLRPRPPRLPRLPRAPPRPLPLPRPLGVPSEGAASGRAGITAGGGPQPAPTAKAERCTWLGATTWTVERLNRAQANSCTLSQSRWLVKDPCCGRVRRSIANSPFLGRSCRLAIVLQ